MIGSLESLLPNEVQLAVGNAKVRSSSCRLHTYKLHTYSCVQVTDDFVLLCRYRYHDAYIGTQVHVFPRLQPLPTYVPYLPIYVKRTVAVPTSSSSAVASWWLCVSTF